MCTPRERYQFVEKMRQYGVPEDLSHLIIRRAAILHTWAEHKCNGVIQRDEETDIPYWYSSITGNRLDRTPDREKGAQQSLIRDLAPYNIVPIFQGDPRGAVVKLKLPDGYTDDWGQTGYCVP